MITERLTSSDSVDDGMLSAVAETAVAAVAEKGVVSGWAAAAVGCCWLLLAGGAAAWGWLLNFKPLPHAPHSRIEHDAYTCMTYLQENATHSNTHQRYC